MYYEGVFGEETLVKLQCDTFFRLVLRLLKDKQKIFNGQSNEVEKFSQTLKYLYLSGHDFTIAGFLKGVGKEPIGQPPFASQLLIEFFEDTSDNEIYVKWIYNSKDMNLIGD